MLNKITKKINSLGISIKYCDLKEEKGIFYFYNSNPIMFINENLTEIETSLVLLHETAHFLNGDCDKHITNHFQNNELEYQANKYMIHEVLILLDEKYNFTTNTNYQQIINNLDLPCHLDGVIIDEFNNIILDKFGMVTTNYHETNYFYE